MTKLDSSMDPEVLESRLDLSRPERRELVDRYVERSALIVGGGADEAADVKKALLEDGWRIEACAGPASANCPLLKGSRSCSKRECVDVALVFVDARRSVTGSLPLVRCAADPASPAVVILEGQADEVAIDGDRALVGALRTARSIADAAGAITGPRPVAPEDT